MFLLLHKTGSFRLKAVFPSVLPQNILMPRKKHLPRLTLNHSKIGNCLFYSPTILHLLPLQNCITEPHNYRKMGSMNEIDRSEKILRFSRGIFLVFVKKFKVSWVLPSAMSCTRDGLQCWKRLSKLFFFHNVFHRIWNINRYS